MTVYEIYLKTAGDPKRIAASIFSSAGIELQEDQLQGWRVSDNLGGSYLLQHLGATDVKLLSNVDGVGDPEMDSYTFVLLISADDEAEARSITEALARACESLGLEHRILP